MKVLAINGSPHGDKGCTAKMLQAILSGMQEAGAKTDIIDLSKCDIHHCVGCFSCWTRTPGKCVFNDSMSIILDK